MKLEVSAVPGDADFPTFEPLNLEPLYLWPQMSQRLLDGFLIDFDFFGIVGSFYAFAREKFNCILIADF